MKISIIVPTYNEKGNLPNLADRVHNSLCDMDYELIIVDDNSPDGTGALAEELSREKPIKVVHRQGKLGLASAAIEGFRHADGDVLGVIDADLQHPPEKIPDLLQKIGGADVAIASRYVDGGGVEG
ncbi:MAG: glycosyltransferase, partial [Dehalococcoidia bacterium]